MELQTVVREVVEEEIWRNRREEEILGSGSGCVINNVCTLSYLILLIILCYKHNCYIKKIKEEL